MRVPVVVVFLLVATMLSVPFNILTTSSLNEAGPSSLSEQSIGRASSAGLNIDYHWAVGQGIVPDQVTGLSVVADGGSLVLSWTPQPGSESYSIYRGLYANAMIKIATTNNTGYTDSNVTDDNIYLYCVHASNQNGSGANSTLATGAISAEGPAPDTSGGNQTMLIIGAICAIAAVAVALIMIRRRKK